MPLPIKIYQYDLDGNFVKEYPSQIMASEEINVSEVSLRRHIWGNRKTCNGFIFTQIPYIKLPKELLPKKSRVNNTSKNIIQYDLNGNLIKEWNRPKEITDTLHIKYKTLHACLNGDNNTCNGFKWKYKHPPK
jgi:hypothetical protein